MSLSAARRLASTLPKRPGDTDLEPVARALVAHAREGHRSPGRSIAKACDHIIADRTLRMRVRTLAREFLGAELASATPLPEPEGPAWLTLDEAALVLGLSVAWMLRALKHPQYRRLWGWPRCLDGQRDWRFAKAFVTGVAAQSSEVEPYHLLPSWCLRAEDVDMGSCPSIT